MISYKKLFVLLEHRHICHSRLVKDGIISSNTLIRLKNNKSLSLYTLEQLSLYLGCSIHELFSIE